MLFGIDVVIVAPGAVATPIWDKIGTLEDGTLATSPYAPALRKALDAVEAGRRGFPPERIGRTVLRALTVAQPRTRYTVTPTPLQQVLVRVLPKRFVDRLIAKRLGLVAGPGPEGSRLL